jgi:hypothetical protein
VATHVDVYVDRGAGGTGDGTSWTNAYTSLDTALAAKQKNISTATGSDEVYHFNCRQTGATKDTAYVRVANTWVTDATGYLIIECTDGTYYLDVAVNQAVIINTAYCRLIGLYIDNADSANADGAAIYVGTTGGDVRIDSCKILGVTAGTAGRCIQVGGGNTHIFNCVLLNADVGVSVDWVVENANTVNVFNCTIYNMTAYGLDRNTATMVAANCVVALTGNDFDGTIDIDNCASDDGDGTAPQTLNAASNYAAEFTNAPGADFSLVVGSVCINNGLSDPSSGKYSDDIVGTARGASWDVGAYEYVAAGGGGSVVPQIMMHYARLRK